MAVLIVSETRMTVTLDLKPIYTVISTTTNAHSAEWSLFMYKIHCFANGRYIGTLQKPNEQDVKYLTSKGGILKGNILEYTTINQIPTN